MHLNKRNKSQHGNTVLTSQYIEKKASLKHEHLIYFNIKKVNVYKNTHIRTMEFRHQLADHFTMESVRNFKKAWQSKNENALSDRFNPYTENGGTCAGIAGKDFVNISGDTRLSASSMVVLSRTAPK
ncbi:proteasome component C5, partial [Trichinella spiralis]|uniref:proteasome component C5 n=1 Tax=Trichinella spiralis TaxID=6334 RepID=UPI0001EFEB75